MSGITIVFAWLGLCIGLVVALGVVNLFSRIMSPAREIDRYTRDILDAGVAIATNLDGVDEAVITRDLASALPALATRYLKKLGLV